MLQAMNTGHEGSLTTVHANSPDDALARLETLAAMSDVEVPFYAVRDQINSAVDVIVQLGRQRGARRVVETAYVASRRQEEFRLERLMHFDQRMVAADGSQGAFVQHVLPRAFVERLAASNVDVSDLELG